MSALFTMLATMIAKIVAEMWKTPKIETNVESNDEGPLSHKPTSVDDVVDLYGGLL